MKYAFNTQEALDAQITIHMGELLITTLDTNPQGEGEVTGKNVIVMVSPSRPERPEDVKSAENTTVTYTAGRLSVTQPRESLLSSWINKGSSVDIHIQVPQGSSITATSGYGNIRAQGVLGTSSLTCAYGDITVEGVSNLTAETSYGEVRLLRATGTTRITANSVSVGELLGESHLKATQGSIAIELAAGIVETSNGYANTDIKTLTGTLNAKTAHGKIRVQDALAGQARLETGYGDVEIGIAEGTLTWLDLKTKGGTVRNELESAGKTPQASPGEHEENTLKVMARTNYGNIRVSKTPGPKQRS